MFDDPNETPAEHALSPSVRAREKSDEFRMHAELCAVFEGCRKFDADLRTKLPAKLAREMQGTMGRLEKSKSALHPVLPEESAPDAAKLLLLPDEQQLSTNDYHICRRPGEVMIVRWLADQQVETFYHRFQSHFDVALNQYCEEARQQHGWKQDPQTMKYLEALDELKVNLSERYLRSEIRQYKLFVLSTQAADEMNILHLCDYVMGVEAAAVVGPQSAPPQEGATEQDLAWYFKLFSLRGLIQGIERMCFFTYLQKTEEAQYWS